MPSSNGLVLVCIMVIACNLVKINATEEQEELQELRMEQLEVAVRELQAEVSLLHDVLNVIVHAELQTDDQNPSLSKRVPYLGARGKRVPYLGARGKRVNFYGNRGKRVNFYGNRG